MTTTKHDYFVAFGSQFSDATLILRTDGKRRIIRYFFGKRRVQIYFWKEARFKCTRYYLAWSSWHLNLKHNSAVNYQVFSAYLYLG